MLLPTNELWLAVDGFWPAGLPKEGNSKAILKKKYSENTTLLLPLMKSSIFASRSRMEACVLVIFSTAACRYV